MNTNNYPNWLVPVELTERLKNVGFDEPCLVYSAKHIQISKNLFIAFKGEIEVSTTSIYFKNCEEYTNSYFKKELKNINIFSIPTWEQVLEWFIKKGFHCYIKKKYFPERYTYHIDYGITTHSKENLRNDMLPKTYKEARHEMVEKLIEIYKNKK